MTALRVLGPDEYIGAVEAISEITDGDHRRCSKSGAAYHVDEDIYFSIEASGHVRLRVGLRPRDDAARCSPSAVAIPITPASGIRSTRCCGADSAAASRSGTPNSAADVRAGTSSVR